MSGDTYKGILYLFKEGGVYIKANKQKGGGAITEGAQL